MSGSLAASVRQINMKIDLRNNEIVWFTANGETNLHKPLSTTFKEIEILNDGRLLIIEDYNDFNYQNKSNLYCLNRQLKIDWFLDFPVEEYKANSGYTGFAVNGEELYANTFNCVRVNFNKDGEIINFRFTK